MTTNYYVTWHVEHDSSSDVHTLKRAYFDNHNDASYYYQSLGEQFAKRLVSPEGNQSFSEEWARFIPGGEVQPEPNVVFWHTGFEDPIHDFKVRYFSDESAAIEFYENLGEIHAKRFVTVNNSDLFSEEWARYLH